MVRQHYHGHHIHRLLLDNSHEISIQPLTNETNETNAISSSFDSNFDTNMVIILAALLCALIFVVGLNSIVRCALRCGRQRLEFETPDQAAALSSTGVKKVAVGQIPVVVYKAGLNTPATDCPICLGEFVEGEKVRILPKCHHGFHVKCIDTWLLSHSSCPNCRQLLFPEEVRTEDWDL